MTRSAIDFARFVTLVAALVAALFTALRLGSADFFLRDTRRFAEVLRVEDLRADFRAEDLRADFRAEDLRADFRVDDLRPDFRADDFRPLFLPVFELPRDDFLAAAMLQAPM